MDMDNRVGIDGGSGVGLGGGGQRGKIGTTVIEQQQKQQQQQPRVLGHGV